MMKSLRAAAGAMKNPSPASGNGNVGVNTSKPSPAEYRKIKAQWANAQLLAEEEARQASLKSASRRKKGAASEEELIEEMKKQDADWSKQINKGKEHEFKRQHLGIVGVLAWLL